VGLPSDADPSQARRRAELLDLGTDVPMAGAVDLRLIRLRCEQLVLAVRIGLVHHAVTVAATAAGEVRSMWRRDGEAAASLLIAPHGRV
jgi:hypothetical protein